MTADNPEKAPSQQNQNCECDPEEKLEPKDWAELAKIAQGSFQNRREMEWKLAFGFWTAIGAFTALFFTIDGFVATTWFCWTLAGLYGILILLVGYLWQYPLHSAHAADRAWFIYYMERSARHRCDGALPTLPAKHPPMKWRN